MSRNRYVSDYRVVESLDDRGRIRSDAEYIGAYYTYVGDPAEVRAARWRVTVGCVIGWMGYIVALVPVSSATRTLYVCLPFVLAALPLMLLTGLATGLYRAKPPFERRYADQLENRAPAASLFAMLSSGLALVAAAVNALVGAQPLWGDAVFCAGSGVILYCGLICHRQWKALKCMTTETNKDNKEDK